MNSLSNSTYKIKATSDQVKEMIEYYQGYLINVTSNYMIARAKVSNATITFYRTNVVLFQGLDELNEYNKWAIKFGLPTLDTEETVHTDYSNLVAIGTDEVGTGDYFGPIVVCATYTTNESIEKLRHLGVKDS
jgi:ribonuclease HIII